MDERQLHYEFMSVSGESHPGLTFEEYRDSCVFLLFYQYLCLRYDEKLEEQYKLSAMVRMAIRGKLQIPSFLRFMEAASPFLHMAERRFELTEFSFYKSLQKLQLLEKQKSYARFFRKLIKKIDAWDCPELLLQKYPDFFWELIQTFAGMKKETWLSGEILRLYGSFFSQLMPEPESVLLPDFGYGLLLGTMVPEKNTSVEISGFEDQERYREIFEIVSYMRGLTQQQVKVSTKEGWASEALFDSIGIFMPEGVEGGTLIGEGQQPAMIRSTAGSISKGELPFILSAMTFLRKNGVLAAVMPGALLYREGRESQLRRYIVEEMNYLDFVMLLPDGMFQSAGQKEVFLLFRHGREEKDVMFFDCSDVEAFDDNQMQSIMSAWKERKTIPGFCSSASQELMKKNEYNLNFPRYITKNIKISHVDLGARRKRIEEIDKELEEIEMQMRMYKRDLEL